MQNIIKKGALVLVGLLAFDFATSLYPIENPLYWLGIVGAAFVITLSIEME